jgi:chaperone required for assembly of F1-ATPase
LGAGLVSESEDDRARRLLTRGEKAKHARRFYKRVGVEGQAAPFCIVLDSRSIRTPMKAVLEVPTWALAEAVRGEWEAQSEVIVPACMPVTRLSNTAIDRVGGDRERIIAEIGEFAGSDLLCYRADAPEGLVERQTTAWDPLLAWMAQVHGARFISVTGLMHEAQPEPTLAAVSEFLSDQDNFALTAIHNLTTLTGSCVLAMALYQGQIEAEDAWAAAHIDEDWQIELWGPDEEAAARRAAYKHEFDATVAFMRLAGSA